MPTLLCNAKNMEDRLIKGCINGDRLCQKRFYHIFAPLMFTVCLRYLGNYHSAQDVLQEAFVKVFREKRDKDVIFTGACRWEIFPRLYRHKA